MDAAMEVAKEFGKNYPPALWASKMVITEGELEQYDVVDLSSRMRARGNNELLGPDPNRTELGRAKLEKREPVFDMSYIKRWETVK